MGLLLTVPRLGRPEKFPTHKERVAAFEALLAHLRAGHARTTFPLCAPTVTKYNIKTYPDVWDIERIEDAERGGRLVWEDLGLRAAQGLVGNFNAAAWIFTMKNRWPEEWRDKHEVEANVTQVVQVLRLADLPGAQIEGEVVEQIEGGE